MFRLRYQLLLHSSDIKSCIFNNFCFSVYVSSCWCRINFTVCINTCSKSRTNTTCTSDRIVMSDITNCKYISDYSVTVSVNLVCISFDVVNNHLSLQFSSLVSIKSYIVCIIIEVQSLFVKFSRRTVRWLTVEPAKRFVCICYGTV